MINFGKYTEKVAFVSFQNVSDGAGGTTPTSTTALTTFASVIQTGASNSIESSDLVLPNTFRIAIQYRTSFTPSEVYQVLYRSKYYKITGVQLNDQRQHKEYIISMTGLQ